MIWGNLLRRWTLRSIHAAVLGASLLGSASAAFAQGGAAASLPRQNFTKSHTFDLPVDMKLEHRAMLSEMRLFMKTPTSPWKMQESAAPHATRFCCKVTEDGEYWYSLVMVDKSGRPTPADVNLEAPSQRVVVDTKAPVIQVQPSTSPGGEYCLRCTVEDAHPDLSSLKAVCRTEFGDIPLEPVPNQVGSFLIKGSEPLRFPVLVSVKDHAGNLATREVNVRDMIGSTLTTKGQPDKTGSDITQVGAKTDVRPGEKPVAPTPRVELPPPKSDIPTAIKNDPPHRVELPPPVSQGTTKAPGGNDTGLRLPNPTSETSPRASAPHMLISSTHAALEYRIDQVGASGVGKVEIYMTPDNGQTWHRLGEDADKNSPADIKLPGDGAYGIRICVTNGNGFGGKTPVRGDMPHCTIEVDTTSPFVQLRSAEVIPSTGQVELRWNAQDRNLGAEPIAIFYRTKNDGPWQNIVRGLKNEGHYRWAIPRDIGGQIFFKIEVADLAMNIAHDTTRQPVVIDLSEPSATVVGVSGMATPRP
jgi:hypothetical protein